MFEDKLHALLSFLEGLQKQGTLRSGQSKQLTVLLPQLKAAQKRQDVERILGEIAHLFLEQPVTCRTSPKP